MKAAVYYETGSPAVFRYEDVPDPVPGAEEILIEVEAIGIEGGDTLNRLGGDLARVPHIVGYQAAGTVVEHGDGVTRFAVGDQVVGIGVDGTHAEKRSVGEGFTWRVPDGLAILRPQRFPLPSGPPTTASSSSAGSRLVKPR